MNLHMDRQVGLTSVWSLRSHCRQTPSTRGNLGLLEEQLTVLFCSRRSPSDFIHYWHAKER